MRSGCLFPRHPPPDNLVLSPHFSDQSPPVSLALRHCARYCWFPHIQTTLLKILLLLKAFQLSSLRMLSIISGAKAFFLDSSHYALTLFSWDGSLLRYISVLLQVDLWLACFTSLSGTSVIGQKHTLTSYPFCCPIKLN